MAQRKTILKHLQTHKRGLTSKEAIEKYGCTRLSAVVAHWRSKGYNIKAEYESVSTRYGHATIAHYYLEA